MAIRFENGKMKTDSLTLTTLVTMIPVIILGAAGGYDGYCIGGLVDGQLGIAPGPNSFSSVLGVLGIAGGYALGARLTFPYILYRNPITL